MSSTQLNFPVLLRNGVRINYSIVNQITAGMNRLLLSVDGQDVYQRLITRGQLSYFDHPALAMLTKLNFVDGTGILLPHVASVIHATAFFNPVIKGILVVSPIVPDSLFYDPLADYCDN